MRKYNEFRKYNSLDDQDRIEETLIIRFRDQDTFADIYNLYDDFTTFEQKLRLKISDMINLIIEHIYQKSSFNKSEETEEINSMDNFYIVN